MRQKSLTRYTRSVSQRASRQAGGITITPLRGFFITLLFLGVPTISLGTMCLSLIQNNLRLSEKNDELQAIASEVKAEVDSLGEEIDTLRERAGVPREADESETAPAVTAPTTTEPDPSLQSSGGRESEAGSSEANGFLSSALLPQGGPALAVDPVDLLKDAQREVPRLNRALDASVKPALEETLAEEAALPTGQPVVGIVEVSSEFGIRGNPFGGGGYENHEGIDFVGEVGDIIAATGDGVVTLAGPNGGYGNTVTIDHGYGYETLYAHMSEVKVNVGERVSRGQIIGYIGSTGRSSGPHLHYSLYKDDQAINPRTLLNLPENNLAQGPR